MCTELPPLAPQAWLWVTSHDSLRAGVGVAIERLRLLVANDDGLWLGLGTIDLP